jgi:CRP-like cAMP-binding protein
MNTSHANGQSRVPNRLLNDLRTGPLSEVASWFEVFTHDAREVLYAPGMPVDHVYFPSTSTISLVARETSGVCAGITLVGNEGVVGLEALTGRHTALQEAACLTSGASFRISRHQFHLAIRRHAQFRQLLLRYYYAHIGALMHLASCNQQHEIEQRLPRWILMTADRCGPEFFLTQEQLSELLGTHRPSISLAAARLQEAGCINYRRGNIVVLDRAELEEQCCACYGYLRRTCMADESH